MSLPDPRMAPSDRFGRAAADMMPAPPVQPSVLQAALENLCAEHPGFDDHIKRLPFDWTDGGPMVGGDFLYPLFGADGADIDALVEHIYRSLVPFCLPRGEVGRITKAALAAGDIHAIIGLGGPWNEVVLVPSRP